MSVKLILIFAVVAVVVVTQVTAAKKNILFLAVDDMRPEINAFSGAAPGMPTPHTPNMDKLAARSMVLQKAYVQQAVCSPTRTSLLTGRRPDTTRVYDLVSYFRTVGGNYTTIPEFFKHNGYTTAGFGKIFHPGTASNNNDPISWTEPYFVPVESWAGYDGPSWYAVKPDEEEAKPLSDTLSANAGIEFLNELAKKRDSGDDKPWFVAIGFHKPHLPQIVPQRFFDLVPQETVHLPENYYAPVDMPTIAWSDYGELRQYKGLRSYSGDINSTLSDSDTINQRRAYAAAVAYTDDLIGKVLSALESSHFNDTIISLWGDHGWQLGEHGEWCKHTNFEYATHAPMLIHVPGKTEQGLNVTSFTEYVDLFPTLAELGTGYKMPACGDDSRTTKLCTEGKSLVPLIEGNAIPMTAAFSQYPRPIPKSESEILSDGGVSSCIKNDSIGCVMGFTVVTTLPSSPSIIYRYTEWVHFHAPFDQEHPSIHWDTNYGTELYDHSEDMAMENTNRAAHDNYADIKQQLQKILRAGWRSTNN